MRKRAVHIIMTMALALATATPKVCASDIDSTATDSTVKQLTATARRDFSRGKEKVQKIKTKIDNDPFITRFRRFFASDTAYVYKPKQRMSVALHNQIYLDFMEFYVPHNDEFVYGLSMRSPARYNLGLSLSYRPFSLSYFLHINNLTKHDLSGIQRTRLHVLNSRFLLNLTLFSDNGKQYVTNYQLGDMREQYKNVAFYGYDFYYANMQMDWFFNHRKYSPSATNSCSSIQKRSAGSFCAGVSYSFQSFKADCTLLPDTIQTTFPINSKIHANSHDFCIDFGYAHNFVFWKQRLTYNITAVPRIGVKRFFQNGDGPKYFVALNPSVDMALVYNRSRYFVNLHLHADMIYNLQNKNTLITTLTDHKLSVGVRF